MAGCLISFGANIGNALETIQLAANLLRKRVVQNDSNFRISRYFRTPPVGGPAGQPPFVNAVAAIETQLTAYEVWNAIRAVEEELGRKRNLRWEARRIDLDVLLYEDLRVWSSQLKIPHPRMCMRRFILLPAMDVAANWIDPVTELSLRQLAEALQDASGSLLLLAENAQAKEIWLQQVAELAIAHVVAFGEVPPPNSRWLSLASPEEFLRASCHLTQAKLTVLLAEGPTEENQWVARLNLVDRQDAGALRITGPRYLLTTEDSDWAIHELVSALEAMDCPVEPIR